MVRQLSKQVAGAIVLGVLLFSAANLVAAEIRPIAADWSPAGMRRVTIGPVEASSTLITEAGHYDPTRAVDGNRATKWVASVPPSEESPQSITIALLDPQKVSGVAVFGERVGNDGIKSGRILLAGSKEGEFKPVAVIGEAESAAWLAEFDPVETTAVRLEITDSPGSSPNTDVYEIIVVGPKLSADEFKSYAKRRMADCAKRYADTQAAAGALDGKGDPQFGDLGRSLGEDKAAWDALSARLGEWDAMNEVAREEFVTEVERLDARLKRRLEGLALAAEVWPERAKELAAVREKAKQAGDEIQVSRDGSILSAANNRVVVAVDETDGTWDATWLGVDAAVRNVRFGLDVDGAALDAPSGKVEAAEVSDKLGDGIEIRQAWGDAVQVERRIRLFHGKPAIAVSVAVTNRGDKEVAIGSASLVDVSKDGWWHLAGVMQAPASMCRPAPGEESGSQETIDYASSDVLAMVPGRLPGAMVLGALSCLEGSPSVRARFRSGEGGTSLQAVFGLGRTLSPGETFVSAWAWLSAEKNGFEGLERYGDAVAAMSEFPVRTGATALWCSWYPIRMTISEQITLAHAEIIAKHFAPLGLKILQLDHGWQQGEICGDWYAKEQFPRGFKWLSEQLESRYGLKLGLWIAPTQVAATSRLFQDHPEWMIQGSDGKPAVTGRWYWVPNPPMTVLDAGHPGAEKWLEETFARLSSEGSCYYKIDFIAGSPSLRKAMAAIRRGAGPDAWIRYCQTPPLVSVGLASSAYQGMDTGDAGLVNWLELERGNAAGLASTYWVNDRLYHREICDMSVGIKADLEEARFKMTMMTMGGCSISYSDDFRDLDLPRIRLMQKCLPPGNPIARPLDLFQSTLPSMWHMRCKAAAGEWDAVGIVNLSDEPQERTVEWDALGLPADTEATVFEFWEEKFLGTHQGNVTVTIAPHTARILLIHPKPSRPGVIATNMHVLGGYHEIGRLDWDDATATLSGVCKRMPDLDGTLYVYVPEGFSPAADSSLVQVDGWLWKKRIVFDEAETEFRMEFANGGPPRRPKRATSVRRRLGVSSDRTAWAGNRRRPHRIDSPWPRAPAMPANKSPIASDGPSRRCRKITPPDSLPPSRSGSSLPSRPLAPCRP